MQLHRLHRLKAGPNRTTQRNRQFLLSLMERWHQPGPDLRECRPGQPTAGRTCSRNVSTVTTLTLLITPPRLKVPGHSDPVKSWNFRKPDWKRICLLTDESIERLPPPDTTNTEKTQHREEFCASLLSEAKQCIPRGRRKNYVPCWDKECETLYRCFLRNPVRSNSDKVPSPLLSRLNQKTHERWGEAVNPIDFSHPSGKAWSAINKLVGRSGNYSRLCPISANSIASQLVKNGTRKSGSRESTRLINNQLSDVWKVATPKGKYISALFRPEVLAATLQHLKPEKYSGLDSIFPECAFHARSALKFGFAIFSLPACANSKSSASGEEH